MHRRRFVTTCLAGAAVLLGGAAWAQQPLDIRVGAAQATDHAPVFAAVERGIFARHGLTARVVMYPTGVEMINGLLAGAQDVNVMGSIAFLAGVANGQPLVLIGHLHGDALRDNYADNNSIVVRAGSGIGEIRALRGKRIGLPRGTGAEGYLLKGSGLSDLVAGVRAVSSGNAFFSPEVARIVVDGSRDGGTPPLGSDLTPREREVLKLVAEGYSSPEIAKLLGLSVKTIEGHRGRIMAKLEAQNVAGLVRHAIRMGLVPTEA